MIVSFNRTVITVQVCDNYDHMLYLKLFIGGGNETFYLTQTKCIAVRFDNNINIKCKVNA